MWDSPDPAAAVVLQGSDVAYAFVQEALPRLQADGIDLVVLYVASAELFDLLPPEQRAASTPRPWRDGPWGSPGSPCPPCTAGSAATWAGPTPCTPSSRATTWGAAGGEGHRRGRARRRGPVPPSAPSPMPWRGAVRAMDAAVFWLYLATLTLLVLHTIDGAYWKEWDLLGPPGGIGGFLLFPHSPAAGGLLGAGSDSGREGGRAGGGAVGSAAAGLVTFGVHVWFLRRGRPEFNAPVSKAIIWACLPVSLALAGWRWRRCWQAAEPNARPAYSPPGLRSAPAPGGAPPAGRAPAPRRRA